MSELDESVYELEEVARLYHTCPGGIDFALA